MNGSSLYQAIGGTAACRSLSEAFYARVARDPVLRPLFPGKTLRCAIEAFTAFLVQFLGGPSQDTQHRLSLSLRESHLRFTIGPRERDAWMNNMIRALDDVVLDDPARRALRQFFERSSAYLVNAGHAPSVADALHPEISLRWNAQLALDEAVAAVHRGAPGHVIALVESPALKDHLENHRAVLASFLAVLIARGDATLHDYARQKLQAAPALAAERYSGRTLLHAAAAAGNIAFVELLLHLNARPGIQDDGGHTPLYAAANECATPEGAAVVRILVQAGAAVDACDGAKRCTALHMAARRGHTAIAAALLDCGAAIEARDSLGETPLRRAVNCNKAAVAALLLERGADPHSPGSKGLTPLTAARTAAMKRLLASARHSERP